MVKKKKPRSMLTSKTTSKPKATLSTRAANGASSFGLCNSVYVRFNVPHKDTNLYTHSDDDQALQVLQGKRRRSESAGTKDKYIGSASSDITRGRAALVAVVPADSDTERHPKKAKVGSLGPAKFTQSTITPSLLACRIHSPLQCHQLCQ